MIQVILVTNSQKLKARPNGPHCVENGFYNPGIAAAVPLIRVTMMDIGIAARKKNLR